MSGRLRCYSFHSVKGGVGKSTLSVATALGLAQHEHARVTLIDMDLTGTSLADVLPLEAPHWAGEAGRLDLIAQPSGFLSLEETRDRMEYRADFKRELMDEEPAGPKARQPWGVPFLNDYLLFATPDWDARQDAHIDSMLWRMRGASELLSVIPSSALPADLEQTISVVFDENYSGFLEGRLEYLLDALVPDEGERVVVVDTPPTIPGLSRSVLSLAFRLAREVKQELSEDGGMPERLRAAPVEWTAFVVGTMDRQDLRAVKRWASLVGDEEQRHLRLLINRATSGDRQQLKTLFSEALDYEPNPILDAPLWVDENSALRFFRSDEAPSVDPRALEFLGKV